MIRLESVESSASAMARSHEPEQAARDHDVQQADEIARASPTLHGDIGGSSRPAHKKSPTQQSDELEDGNSDSHVWRMVKHTIGLRRWGSWGSKLHTADAASVHPAAFSQESSQGFRSGYGAHNRTFLMRPRAGGKLGSSFRGSFRKIGRAAEEEGLVIQEQIGEGTCGLVYRALFNGKSVAAKVLKGTEKYESEGTCPVDAKESFQRCVRIAACVYIAPPESSLYSTLFGTYPGSYSPVPRGEYDAQQGNRRSGALRAPEHRCPPGCKDPAPWTPGHDRGVDEVHVGGIFRPTEEHLHRQCLPGPVAPGSRSLLTDSSLISPHDLT